MSVQHVQDKDNVIIVTIPDSKSRCQRVFTITDGTTKNLHLYRSYVSLRPPQISHHRLFLSYRSSKCTVQPVGINTFSKIPSLIAKYLNLSDPDLYTGHCFRRSSASMLVARRGNILTLKTHGDCGSSSVVKEYIDNNLAGKVLGEDIPTTSSTIDEVDNMQLY